MLNKALKYILALILIITLSATIHTQIKPGIWPLYSVHLLFLAALMIIYLYIIPKDKRSEYLLGLVVFKFFGYLIYAFVLSR